MLLLRLALLGCSVTVHAAGTQANHSYPRLGNCW
jgi:hypothetical protein